MRSRSTTARTRGSRSALATFAGSRKGWPRDGDDDRAGAQDPGGRRVVRDGRDARRDLAVRRQRRRRRWPTAARDDAGAGGRRRRAGDARARCRRTSARRCSTGVAGLLRERRDEFAGRSHRRPASRSRPRRSRPTGRCRRSSSRPLEARALGGELIGDGRAPGRRGPRRHGRAPADRRRRGDLAVQLPAQPGGAQDRAGVRRGLRVVLKPAGATPLSALLLARAFADAGQPAGWLNVIVGRSSEIGDVLIDDPTGQADHVHRLVGRGLEAPRAGGAQEGEPRARKLDARSS